MLNFLVGFKLNLILVVLKNPIQQRDSAIVVKFSIKTVHDAIGIVPIGYDIPPFFSNVSRAIRPFAVGDELWNVKGLAL